MSNGGKLGNIIDFAFSSRATRLTNELGGIQHVAVVVVIARTDLDRKTTGARFRLTRDMNFFFFPIHVFSRAS